MEPGQDQRCLNVGTELLTWYPVLSIMYWNLYKTRKGQLARDIAVLKAP